MNDFKTETINEMIKVLTRTKSLIRKGWTKGTYEMMIFVVVILIYLFGWSLLIVSKGWKR